MTETNHRVAAHLLETSVQDFKSMKKLGDGALSQFDAAGIHWKPEPESNSAAIIVKHMAGNMVSRWTDFLTTDGEKPDRDRDDEFDAGELDPDGLLALWEHGWAILFGALEALTPDDVLRTVAIRGQPHTVLQAIHRQISHYGYHVGQLVYVAKAYRSSDWRTLSIPKGKSQAFNDAMNRP
ncbi:DUF1572 family protein [Cohnella sp. REN36]|uniref:DUF1572 family protein n=1 Tax=Cohnella sp. REN36 TaxID=2887347 RepID=UPI001D14F3F4|nr:DUF1572 family protein [Cohnella sp. REN36]MCC3372769.1 DUF1572 domain-containing protein [Cohnella sp. REN36]